MDKKYKDFEADIKGKHSFAFTPKYKEEFRIAIKARVFVEIAKMAFEALDWELVYFDDHQIEAKRANSFGSSTHSIVAKANHSGEVEVRSESLGNEMWDMGKNSKRVKLFIFAFNEVLKDYDADKLVELEKEVERKDNWDDYEVPESLPAPEKYKEPQLWVPLLGVGIVSLVLAFVIALLSLEGMYVIFLFELGVGVSLAFVLKLLMKQGNYTDWGKIKYVLIGGIVLTFLMNQVFQYQLVLARYGNDPIGFFEFIKLRMEQGLTIKSMNVGVIGLVVSWAIQIGLSYLIGFLRTIAAIVNISIERVPVEVIDYAMYHFVKGKNELAVKHELSKMGWKSDLEQEMVMEAIGGIQGGQEYRRNLN